MSTNATDYQREYMRARRAKQGCKQYGHIVVEPVYEKMLEERPKIKHRRDVWNEMLLIDN
jgi:hypothetical protein